MANQQGTGKHGHKDTKEPYPHHGKASGSSHTGASSSHGGHSGETRSHSGDSARSESSDLKSREYRDKDGNIHHHTHTAGKSK